MDDMNAFERQVAGRIQHHAGPIRPVDDAAIFTAITATQPPRWRFQSMFSATKFVVAGAVVALFGGLLLAGVLTIPSEESAPAAPSPSATAELLSTLDTEEVAPGVFRVLSDGHRALDKKVDSVAITPEGDVWVLKYSGQGESVRIVRLGEPGVAYQNDDAAGPAGLGLGRLVTGDDGTIGYAQGIYEVPAVLDGHEWVTHDGSDYEDCVRLFGSVATDGMCFEYEDYGTGLMWLEDGGERERVTASDLGYGFDIRLGKPVSGDGIVWTAAYRDGREGITYEGLARYDGQSWTSRPYPDQGIPPAGPLAVGPDGIVWIPSYTDSDGLTIASWDGETWHSYGPLAVPQAAVDAHFHQDGTINFGVMAAFDGTTLTRLAVPDGVVRGMYGPLTYAPDGSAWVVRGDSLYVFTPEAIATESQTGLASQLERSRQGVEPSPTGPRSSG